MATADLPPALEIVRQALLVHPTPVVAGLEVQWPTHLEARLQEMSDAFERKNRQGMASLAALNNGLDLLQAQVGDTINPPVAHLEIIRAAFDVRLHDASEGVEGFESLIAEPRLKELPRSVRSRLLKVLRRGLAMCERYEAGIIRAQDRVLVMLIDADPESRATVDRASSAAEVHGFFERLSPGV